MELLDAIRRRRMVREFDGTEIAASELAALCAEALRAPTAGNSRGVELVVLAGREGAARYLEAATDAGWRSTSPRFRGLSLAGAAVVVLCSPSAYASRYSEPDKASSGLGDVAAWPVPYWYGDAGAATMALLLLATDRGLGACFLGAFRAHDAVLEALDAPAGRRLYGAVLLGGAAPRQVRSASLLRPGPSRSERVVLGRYDRDAR